MQKLAGKIEDLPWIEDGIDGRAEMKAALGLVRVAEEGYTARLISEPWVVEGSNYAALTFPVTWHYLNGSVVWNLYDALARVFAYPAFRDGISAQESKILTVASSPGIGRPPEARVTDLDLAGLDLEERTITLPLAQDTELSIIRTGQAGDYAMDGLEHSVRRIEEFMGLPFPRRQVIYLIDDRATGWGKATETHVAIGADELRQGVFSRGSFTSSNKEWILETIAHEAAHYYWRGSPRWLSEGPATFMESVVADTLHGAFNLQGVLCPVRSIAASQSQSADCFDACPYVLGESLFRGLYHAMDDDTAFRLAFRRLYLHTQYDLPDDGCDKGKGLETACHVREAFTAYAREDKVDAVEKEIARWFDGVGQPSVRVAVTGPDGKLFGSPDGTRSQVALMFVGPDNRTNRPERYEVESIDSTFDLIMPPGTFTVEVRIPVSKPNGTAWEFVGWYNGKGSITTDPSQAFQVIVDGTQVEGIDIMLPTNTEGLLCPPGSWRSTRTGSCVSQ